MRDKPYPKWKFWRHPTEMDATFYARWNDMKNRLKREVWYIGKKCLRKDFSEFYIDMYDEFVKHYNTYGKYETTLDRINSNWDYCKENCRRATRLQQSQNRNYNVNYTINWETYCEAEWLRITWLSFYGFKSKMDLLQSGEITEEEFLDKEYRPKSQTYFIIWWKRYRSLDLQLKIWVARWTLNARYKKLSAWLISEEEFFAPPDKRSIRMQQKINIDWAEYLITDLANMWNVTRDTVVVWYNKLQNNKITKEKFKQRFNIL